MRQSQAAALVVLPVSLLVSSLAHAHTLHIPLRVTERAGVARSGEWVQSGVPLPQAAQVYTTSGLAVLASDGTAVNADFTVTSRWGGAAEDSSKAIRWLLVSFPCDVAAGGASEFHLTDQRVAPPAARITLSEGPDVWTVSTGAAVFEIGTASFDLFHRVTVAGVELVSPSPDNGPYYTLAGDTYRASTASGAPSLAVHRQGPRGQTLAIKVSGAHRTNEDSLDEDLEYRVYLTFFAGSSAVRLHHTIQNNRTWVPLENNADFRNIGSPNSVAADEIGLQLQVNAGLEPAWTLATEGGRLFSGPLLATVKAYQDSSGDPAWDLWKVARGTGDDPVDDPLYGPTSYVSFRGYRAYEGAQPIDAGDKLSGWLDLQGSQGGLTVTVQSLWQNFPEALRVTDSGIVQAALFPDEFRSRHSLRVGEQKTHEILLQFHAPGDPSFGSAARGFQQPLLALAPPSWYAQIGRVIPTVSSDTPDSYRFDTIPANGDTQVDITPQEWDAFLLRHLEGPGVPDYSFNGMDEAVPAAQLYGWMDWGDLPLDFEDENACGSSGVARSITGQYGWKYDGDYGLIVDFLRSADWRFWDYAAPAIRHTADIDILHHGRQSGRGINDFRDGGIFGHEQHDQNGDRNPHRNGDPDSRCGGAGWNGTPTADMICGLGAISLMAQVTGDPALHESLLDLAEWTLFFADNHPDYTQGRGAANALNTLAWAWQATGDARYRACADRVVERGTIFYRPLGNGLIDPLAADALGRWVLILREAGDYHLDELLANMASGPIHIQQSVWDFPRADLFAWAALALPQGKETYWGKADAHFASAVRNPASWPDPLYGIQVVWQIKEWVLSLRMGHPYQLMTYDRRGGPKFAPEPSPLADVLETVQNTPPSARIAGGSRRERRAGETLVFDGSGSSDAETPAAELHHFWDFGDGVTASGAIVEHTYQEPGEWIALLYVSDSEAVDLARQTISVLFVNHHPVAAAGPDRQVPLGVEVLFDGRASHDPDGQDITWSWDFGDGTGASGERVRHTFHEIGPYRVLLRVSDGELAGQDSATVRVGEAGERAFTVTLQDGLDGYAGCRDVRLWSKYPEGNYGAAPELIVGRNDSPELQSLVSFELPRLLAGSLVETATLELTVVSPAPGAIEVHRATTSWVEGSGTWGNTTDGATWSTSDGTHGWESGWGADFDEQVIATFTAETQGERVAVDVTSLVQYWVTGTANDGLVLHPDPSANFWYAWFSAREESTAARRPSLTVTYRPLRSRCAQSGNYPVDRRHGNRAASAEATPARSSCHAPLLALAALGALPGHDGALAAAAPRSQRQRHTVRLGACATSEPSTSFNTMVTE
ncbi:MAG: PKD domain-containing protein [Planctomycetota bacterium]